MMPMSQPRRRCWAYVRHGLVVEKMPVMVSGDCLGGWGFGSTLSPVLYRQPGPAPESFLHDQESLISTYPKDHIILGLGDFNIDFLDENVSYD